jgi:hypothetical protein
MSLLKAIKAQLGLSVTPANNFTLDASADDGTMKLVKGASTNVMEVAADGKVTFPQNAAALAQTAIVNTTSGTSHLITGIPSTAKRVTLALNKVSLSGSARVFVRVGTGGTASNTGYESSVSFSSTHEYSTVGVMVLPSTINAATNEVSGLLTFLHVGGNLWCYTSEVSVFTGGTGVGVCSGSGRVQLSGALDCVQIYSTNGTDTFDLGSANVTYES